NLSILAQNYTEYELVGAIDNADLNSVKRHGAALFFMYAKFKEIIPQSVDEKDNKNAEVESADEKQHRQDTGEDPDF
ncbi:MAG: hypothetical protein II923_05320, partial [Campylobacter sp.]|nr:hypothetical protein [Campylobacter sp.]